MSDSRPGQTVVVKQHIRNTVILIAGLQVHSLPSAFGFFADSDTVAHWHLNENIYTGPLPDDLGGEDGGKRKGDQLHLIGNGLKVYFCGWTSALQG